LGVSHSFVFNETGALSQGFFVKNKSDFSITFTRRGEVNGRCFSFSLQQCVFTFIACVCLLTGFIFAGVHYYRMWEQTLDYARLKLEVDRLQREEEETKVAAKQLGDRISELQVTAQKLRIASGFDPDSLGGSGGPASKADPVLSLSSGDLSRHFRTLDRKRITLQTELRQLQDYYTTREILLASTPSIMPVRGYPSDRFGKRVDPITGEDDYHPGIDISAPRGSKVVATADGLVVFAGRRHDYGNLVTIEHKFGVSTRYGHLQNFVVKPGQRVKRGDIIGYVGSTGRTTGPHLHYEVRLRNQALNPLRFLQDSDN